MAEELKFKCPSCGHEEMRLKFCPFTGMLHGRGWAHTCPHCRDEMEVINEE